MGRSPLDDYLDEQAGLARPAHGHVPALDESGNRSDPGGGPEGVHEAVGRGTGRPDAGDAPEAVEAVALAAVGDPDAPCLPCAAGLHSECDRIWTDRATFAARGCCDGGKSALEAAFDAIWGEPERLDEEPDDGPERPPAYFEGFTGRKALTDYVDPLSTGRKEAARKFPIEKGMVCEWAWLAAAGGGVAPIVGCPGYPATDIHHGPDKNTLRNVVGNVHRICANCHNRWHGANDPHYGERPPADQPFLPLVSEWVEHDPVTKASDEQVFAEEGRRRNESRRHGNLV